MEDVVRLEANVYLSGSSMYSMEFAFQFHTFRIKDEPMVEFAINVAVHQHDLGKYLTIENPESSAMWSLPIMKDLINLDGVSFGAAHICAYGLVDPVSRLPMRKAMKFVHNLPDENMVEVFKKCTKDHEHQLVAGRCPGHGSRAVISQVYPELFCKAVAKALSSTQSPKKQSNLRSDVLKQRLRSKSPKSHGQRPEPDKDALDDLWPIGQCGEYRLLMSTGTLVPELESIPSREVVDLIPMKEINPKRSQIDALVAHVRAKMLVEHLAEHKEFYHFKCGDVDVQAHLDASGDELEYESGDTLDEKAFHNAR